MLIFDGQRLSHTYSVAKLKKAARSIGLDWKKVVVDSDDRVYLEVSSPFFISRVEGLRPKAVNPTELDLQALRSAGKVVERRVRGNTTKGEKTSLRLPTKPKNDFYKRKERLYRYIADTRPPFSEISGDPLPMKEKFVYSHLVSTGSNRGLAFFPVNIALMTHSEHQTWEFERHRVEDDPRWQWVFILHDRIVEEYWAVKKGGVPKMLVGEIQ